MRAAVAVLVLLTSSTLGAKPGPKPINAQFLCGLFVDGKIKEVVGNGRRAKVTHPIACAMHLEDPKQTRTGNVHTIRYTTDVMTSKPKQIVTTGKTGEFGASAKAIDLEIVMTPDGNDEHGELLFRPCEDFDIVATIADGAGVAYAKTLKIQQDCSNLK
jgi:hypothetical protein